MLYNYTYLGQRFIDLTDYRLPTNVKSKCAEMSTNCSEVISLSIDRYTGTLSQKHRIISILNSMNTATVVGDKFDFDISYFDSFESIYSIDYMKSVLGLAYIKFDEVKWDISSILIDNLDVTRSINQDIKYDLESSNPVIDHTDDIKLDSIKKVDESEGYTEYKSSREDISFQFPEFPRFNTSKIWALCEDDGGRCIPIFYSIPEIPETQNQINITTDWTKMTDSEFLRLYPDHTIQTRRPEMYVRHYGFEFDELVGYIPKITGFTRDQIVDNIIKYPQFNFMYRMVDGRRVSFMKHIEVDGELLTLQYAKNNIEDIYNLPDDKVFYWDYIIRRYLLERDYETVNHKYPLLGYFHPYITLFTTPSIYRSRGYNDILDMAKKCVRCRVLFYQSRNPLLKRMFDDAE